MSAGESGVGERECRYPCDCGEFPEEHCACMEGHAASTDPAPEGGLREAIRQVTSVADWARPSVDLHAIGRWSMAMDVRDALAAHPAPETP